MENNNNKLLEILNLQLFAEEEIEDEKDEDNEEHPLDDNDFEDDDEPSGNEKENKENTSKTKQSREENSRQAQLRREREQKEKEEKLKREAYVKGQLDSTKVNTFTNQEITDEYDLEIYKLQQKIKERGGDPIEDLPRELAKIEREKAQKLSQEQELEKARNEKAKNDYKEIKEKYPRLDVNNLLQDPNFKAFSKKRIESESLLELYEDFKEFKKSIVNSYKLEQEEKRKKEESKDDNKAPGISSIVNNEKAKSYTELTEAERYEQLRKEGLIR